MWIHTQKNKWIVQFDWWFAVKSVCLHLDTFVLVRVHPLLPSANNMRSTINFVHVHSVIVSTSFAFVCVCSQIESKGSDLWFPWLKQMHLVLDQCLLDLGGQISISKYVGECRMNTSLLRLEGICCIYHNFSVAHTNSTWACRLFRHCFVLQADQSQ